MDLSREKPSKNVEVREKPKKKKIPSLSEMAGAISENAPTGSLPKKGWGKARTGKSESSGW